MDVVRGGHYFPFAAHCWFSFAVGLCHLLQWRLGQRCDEWTGDGQARGHVAEVGPGGEAEGRE
jgi:hypothetical protein